MAMGFLFIIIGMLTGCSSLLQMLEDKPPAPETGSIGSIEHALAVYQDGEYMQAAKLFASLIKTDISKEQRHTAVLGEICCRLLIADSQEQYQTALGMWEKFRESAEGKRPQVELTLLDPLITRLVVLDSDLPIMTQPMPTPGAMHPISGNGQDQLEANETILRKKAGQADKLQRQLDAVRAQNKILKQKIKALEAIDQNIQKKKTQISAPSE